MAPLKTSRPKGGKGRARTKSDAKQKFPRFPEALLLERKFAEIIVAAPTTLKKVARNRHLEAIKKAVQAIERALQEYEPEVRRRLACWLFLRARTLYLENLAIAADEADQLPETPLLRLQLCDGTPVFKRRKLDNDPALLAAEGRFNPGDPNYNRDAHIHHIAQSGQLIGFDFAANENDDATVQRLLTGLGNLRVRWKQRRQEQEPRLLPVGMVVKLVHFFAKTFGERGSEQLSTLIASMKKSRLEMANWNSECRLSGGAVQQPKDTGEVPQAGSTIAVGDNNAPSSVIELFQRLRADLDVNAPNTRVTQVVRLHRKWNVLQYYLRIKRVLGAKDEKLTGDESREKKELETYLDDGGAKVGRNSLERLHARLFTDLSYGVGDTSMSARQKWIKDIKKCHPLFQMKGVFGRGILALVQANAGTVFIKDFPLSAVEEVIKEVGNLLPNAVKLCRYLDKQVMEPLFRGQAFKVPDEAVESAAKLLRWGATEGPPSAEDENGGAPHEPQEVPGMGLDPHGSSDNPEQGPRDDADTPDVVDTMPNGSPTALGDTVAPGTGGGPHQPGGDISATTFRFDREISYEEASQLLFDLDDDDDDDEFWQ